MRPQHPTLEGNPRHRGPILDDASTALDRHARRPGRGVVRALATRTLALALSAAAAAQATPLKAEPPAVTALEAQAHAALFAMWEPLVEADASAASERLRAQCGQRTRLLFENRPYRPRDDSLEGGRTLYWSLDDCRPSGAARARLNGAVIITLVRDDHYGPTALVEPIDLRVSHGSDRQVLRRRFTISRTAP